MRKYYEYDTDYILDVLEDEEEKLVHEIIENLSEKMKCKFAKFLAIKNTIEKINVENAFDKRIRGQKAI